jgi:hypothetical protein
VAELYRQCWQIGTGTPGTYETKLADALEAAFGAGHHEIEAVVSALNGAGVARPGGGVWTAALFEAEIRRLGA